MFSDWSLDIGIDLQGYTNFIICYDVGMNFLFDNNKTTTIVMISKLIHLVNRHHSAVIDCK